ncbi:nitrite/sulfite reductase [Novispirillum itersonii]|uniref:Sulfite reductase (NADPH) hemoprotein beta-component n=1 Tax=Novispirillum itersonii TaxID=189 RepID=A0A7W9ZFX3_NOVIT|nr:nitrite/sulfite reductase [Novispirillum itersonii]MBB6209549.1 sulfite reductase (NADPH) hemoprotein beta-component [Novispirillum itersonii]
MYRYDEFDHQVVRERVAEFSDQVSRRLSGDLSEEQFRPLRLMNGVYLQLHAYMLRVAVPYGELTSGKMRRLAHIARVYDRGYGHFTTRQNIQFNWPKLSDIPAILKELAEVEMHAIQTSGNCIRNVTTDAFAGVAADEIEDPRPWAEVLRQWSTFHPEFTYLPRKFKIAISGGAQDRAATFFHDIGIRLVRAESGDAGFQIIVGGGMGRTPRVGRVLNGFVAKSEILSYLEAILRVYNLHGRRDNKYKARIKILVDALTLEGFRAEVDAEWQRIRGSVVEVPAEEVERIGAYFADPDWQALADNPPELAAARSRSSAFNGWVSANVMAHRVPGYAAVTVSLKPVGGIPGDATADQMDALADFADRYSLGALRVSKEQNIVLPYVRQDQLHALWQALVAEGLATANKGLISDIIACPGLDYCALANARSIPLAQMISERFSDIARQHDIGEVTLNISGCINACGHHHVGNIGILGVDKRGEESYQLVLGGDATQTAAIGDIAGPGFTAEGVVDAIETVIGVYLAQRQNGEPFIDTYRRIGLTPFKEAINAAR